MYSHLVANMQYISEIWVSFHGAFQPPGMLEKQSHCQCLTSSLGVMRPQDLPGKNNRQNHSSGGMEMFPEHQLLF